jgi:4-amino-4-deoxychorismate lyase
MQLLETIRCQNGELENLFYHEARLARARRDLFGQTDRWYLEEAITVPDTLAPEQVYRCRVLYGAGGIESVEFIPYQVRPVQRLELTDLGTLGYDYKFADRRALNAAVDRSAADEVLFVRDGLLTDASYANVALFDGASWYTPHAPLLAGTRRAQLLAEGVLIPERLAAEDLRYFQKIRLLNALMRWEEGPEVPIHAVIKKAADP